MRRFAYSVDPWYTRWQYSEAWWAISRFGSKVRGLPNNIVTGIRNIIRYLPLIWNDRDWDWMYLALLMEAKLRYMSVSTKDWHVMGAPRTRRQTMICAHLLHRILADDYMTNAQKSFPYRAALLMSERQKKEDLAYFGKLMGKHMIGWWD